MTGEDWTDRIKQVHGDYHLGLESSRQRVVPASRRCSDFRHLVAATKRKQLAGPGEEIERVNVWRQGIMAVLKSKCQSEDCLPVLERAVYISRILCHGAFSTLWQTVLDWLRLCGEGAAAGTLEKYYLEVQDGQWDASWRCSVDVALPGFGTGSQSQEAWHRHRLKSSLGSIKMELSQVFDSLSRFLSCRAQTLKRAPVFSNLPARVWDPVLLRGAALNKVGRTPANDFFAAKAYITWRESDGSVFYVMRRSLLFWNGDACKWERHENVLSLAATEAKSVARILTSDSSQEVMKDILRVACSYFF